MKLFDLINSMTGSSDPHDRNSNNVSSIEHISAQPESDRSLISFVTSKMDECKNNAVRVANENIWLTNLAYMMGYTSIYYDNITRSFKPLNSDFKFVRRNGLNINKVLPTVQRRLARLCRFAPRYEVVPDDLTEDAKNIARKEEQILKHFWDSLRLNELRLELMMHVQTCGHAYLHVSWDSSKGDPIEAEMEFENEDGQIETRQEFEYSGDVGVDVASAFEIYPDPLAKSDKECRFYIRSKVRHLDYFRTHYPERGWLVKEEGVFNLGNMYQESINNLAAGQNSSFGKYSQVQNAAVEIAYYEKRSVKHPNGRMIVVANGVLLCDKDLPVGEIPLVKFDDIIMPGKFYPESVVTHLRPVQDQLTRVIRKRADWTNKLLSGKLIAPRGSDIAMESLTDRNGEIFYFDSVPNASEPKPFQMPMIPEYAYKEEDRLNNMFYDIAGEGEVSRGILPSSSIPAIGMELLLEQDQTRIAVMTEQHEHAFAKVGSLILKYAEAFISDEKLIYISDPNSNLQVMKMTPSDLKTKHNVLVVRGSLAQSSLAQRRNDIRNAYQMGLFGSPQDPMVISKVIQAMEFGSIKDVWRDFSLDMAQIERDIQDIEQGMVPEVNELDNHALHIQEKNRYRKSEKFLILNELSQAILLENINQHLEWQAKFLGAMQGIPPNRDLALDQANANSEADLQASQAGKLPQTGL